MKTLVSYNKGVLNNAEVIQYVFMRIAGILLHSSTKQRRGILDSPWLPIGLKT